MTKKNGVSGNDLRPFSVEDPLGTGHKKRSSQTRASEHRASRTSDGDSIGAQAAEAARNYQAPPAPTPQPQRPPRNQGQQAQGKKGGGCGAALGFGCLGMLVLVGLVIALPIYFIAPDIYNAYQQWQLTTSGEEVAARVVALEPTSTTLNESTVHDVTLELQEVGKEPRKIQFRQALSSDEVSRLRAGGWAVARIDQANPQLAVIVEFGEAVRSPDPQQGQAQGLGGAGQGGLIARPTPKGPIRAPTPSTGAGLGSSASHGNLCQQTYACCLTVQGPEAKESCATFLKPSPTSAHCKQALPIFRDVGEKIGRSCK